MGEARLPSAKPSVTARQWEVAGLIALGYSNAEIAAELGISLAGAKYHVAELLLRLDVESREAVAAWYRDERLQQREAPELLEAAMRRGWPADLVHRALALHLPRHRIAQWLRGPLSAAQVDTEIRRYERVMLGDLRARIADADDADRLADLYVNAPQEIDGWELTVERRPNPFAQLRLQEHAWVQIVEEGGLVHAAVSNSVRETLIGGRRVSVLFRYAAKVRQSSRGEGFGGLSLWAPPAGAPAAYGIYYFVRDRNLHLLRWLQTMAPAAAELREPCPGTMPGIPVWIDHVPATELPGATCGIRPARRSDLRRCVALINRTHHGLDLFRPYTPEFLEHRLNDSSWGPKPSWWTPVYGWPDYHVVEDRGTVVACGGLWARGRDIRDVWFCPGTGQRRTVAVSALMDFGFAEGHEDALVQLIDRFSTIAAERGHTHVAVPLQWLPALRVRLACRDIERESRLLVWRLSEGDRSVIDRSVTRPYIDLAYWA